MSQDEPVTLPGDAEPEPEAPSALPADPVDQEPRAALPDLPLVAPSTTIESAAQNALIDRVNARGWSRMIPSDGTGAAVSNGWSKDLGLVLPPVPSKGYVEFHVHGGVCGFSGSSITGMTIELMRADPASPLGGLSGSTVSVGAIAAGQWGRFGSLSNAVDVAAGQRPSVSIRVFVAPAVTFWVEFRYSARFVPTA